MIKQHTQQLHVTLTVAFRIYTHAHNTTDPVAQACLHGYTQLADARWIFLIFNTVHSSLCLTTFDNHSVLDTFTPHLSVHVNNFIDDYKALFIIQTIYIYIYELLPF